MGKSPSAYTVCSKCHEPLNAEGRCMNCLLRGGLLEETLVHEEPVPMAYGDYEIARHEDGSPWELGRGAMGVTYRATDRALHRPVALKVIQTAGDAGNHRAVRERFLREARAAAALRHANVAAVFQLGVSEESGGCYYAMELVEGETLEARVRRDGPLDVRSTLELARQVAAALTAAASRNLIHRDLKPGNLMLSGGNGQPEALEVKVIDFGLAKAAAVIEGENDLTHGGFVGTPAFASPEQFGGESVDARSDFYSLGVTLWYALTAQVPFAGTGLAQLRYHPAREHLPVEQLAARSVPAPVVDLLRSLLAVEQIERPQSAAALLNAIDLCRRQTQALSDHRARSLAGRDKPFATPWLAVGGVIMIALAVCGLWWGARSLHPAMSRPTPARMPLSAPLEPPVPEKSVAVLPFDNFSGDKDQDSAVLADGVQEEVLTDLAKIADLKVISRSSVMQYKDAKERNLREIGRALGVAHVVEGSVQKSGSQIRVTAKLIDARTAIERWGEKYDRELQNVFTIQSDIAQAIAGHLQAVISPQEHAAMAEAPTHDLKAYALYLQARQAQDDSDQGADRRSTYERTLSLLTQAVASDPTFARAFSFMTYVQAVIYRAFEATPEQEAIVRDLAQTVARLRPDSGEAHLAMGDYDYLVRFDYPGARTEYAAAVRLLPNDSEAIERLAVTDRRQGRWEDARAHNRRAAELDPNSADVAERTMQILVSQRRYPEAVAIMDRWIASKPQVLWTHDAKARTLLAWKADPAAARAALAALPAEYDPHGNTTESRLRCDYCTRDFAAAERDLAACSLAELNGDCDVPDTIGVPRALYEGYTARYRGEKAVAMTAFNTARAWLEAKVREHPRDATTLIYLASADAALGRKEEALAESHHAVTMHPPEQDAVEGPAFLLMLARVLAWTGERDDAIRTLQTLCAQPNGPNYGYLHLHPDWDSLRGDPRFETMAGSLAPKP